MQSIDRILDYFEKINAIPRCSRNEAALCRWLQHWAMQRGFATAGDNAGNQVVRLPASPGAEKAPTVVIQSHMDMVCEKTPDSNHDFAKDPIRSVRKGDWLMADRTTLGADNGIAIAYALAVADDPNLRRPPMELLFTVDEETGLNGVKQMGRDLIQGRILLNLDSEDEGIFTVGCAGGVDSNLSRELPTEKLCDGWGHYELVVGGLNGGHSGIDIHRHRANANKLLARTLSALTKRSDCRIVSLDGGSRHNAIARDARAVVACAADRDGIKAVVAEMEKTFREEYGENEAGLVLSAGPAAGSVSVGLTLQASQQVMALLLALPHGVAGMSPSLSGLVETSSNLAITCVKEGRLRILTSQRSAVVSRLAEITAAVRAVAELAGVEVREENKYPPWPPRMEDPLLQQAKETYAQLFGKQPVIQVIHAGLECAIIGAMYPGIQMISLGPTIRSPHSPSERLHIPSVQQVWQFLVALLERLSRA
ncbi:MAG: aminoacyl-histidine dipeptidase [Desulfobacterales bacterium]|nr:aminoacyl-histidine dipeptidase [Desulfobacterales bacterium]